MAERGFHRGNALGSDAPKTNCLTFSTMLNTAASSWKENVSSMVLLRSGRKIASLD
jgi:hypothetical protein